MHLHSKIAALSIASLAAASLLTGCVVRERTTVYERPHRVYVAEPGPPPPVVYAPAPAPVVVAPAPAPIMVAPAPVVVEDPSVIIVHRPPPAIRAEVRTRSPGRDYVWVPGYYRARGETWEWVGGGWQRPPRRGAVWVEPRYENRGSEVHVTLGFWR